MVRSMMNFIELSPSFWGYALETAAMLLNMAPSKAIPHTPYKIWHGKPASYKYLRVFPEDNRQDEVLLEESSETPQQNDATSFEPSIPTDGIPVLCRSSRESQPLERYRFIGLTSQLHNDPRTYGEAMLDIDLDKRLEAMKSEMNSRVQIKFGLVDPPKGASPVGEVTTFKAKIVAKGYTQRPGVDFEETYSLVAMAKSIQILLPIAA
ncbi:UNVERIFIED_CONTAM: Retrovirus-related Pol polyprotein from transposon RE2 [Sesamum angustifolium]|uniref:Retrovirus-related Pol polyprotein from transposon RE2 n=1 Tax=Sesamum angustifolium TaxID=2727405 RepID=A0AAW2LUC5_9LAMI